MTARISVIVPVYKIENLLARCVESILLQTYTNLEIILVDDGSPDTCPEICDALRLEDHRVRVIHKQNGGLSSARNAGMDIATGDYILFIDGDDWIALDMIEILYTALTEYDADIAECSFYNAFTDFYREETACTGKVIVGDSLDAIAGILDWENFYPMAWNKLYKRSLMQSIRYPVGKLHEDEFTTHRFYLAAHKIVFVDVAKYYYDRSREDSITNQKFNVRSLDVMQALRRRMHCIWDCQYTSIEQKMNDVYSWVLFERLLQCYNHVVEGPKVHRVIREALEDWGQMRRENRPLAPHYAMVYGALEKGLEEFALVWNGIKGG